jgi:selenocysteine lyase/cysteine desulfurase
MIPALSDRSQYNSLDDCVYLNQASLGLIGQPAVTAMHEFLDAVGRHGNMNMTDRDEVGFFGALREQAAELLCCGEERLAIVGSAGEMLSQLPALFRPPPRTRVLSISSEFPAITRPWLAYASENDCVLEFVDDTEREELTDALIRGIDERTSVVAISHVQFSTGSLVDVPRVREATRQVGAMLMIDVTQSAGAIPIDAASWDAEVVVCSGYKWLGGHGGVGLAVISPTFLSSPPPAPGWMGAPDPFDFQATQLPLAEDARRYTQSTMSYVSMKGLTVAIAELLRLGPTSIESHARSLATLLIDQLEGSDWMPFGGAGRALAAPHIVALTHRGGDVDIAMRALRDEGIVCSSRNGMIRVSLAHYNDEDDVRSLAQALKRSSSGGR